jgi:hypothetical protein
VAKKAIEGGAGHGGKVRWDEWRVMSDETAGREGNDE